MKKALLYFATGQRRLLRQIKKQKSSWHIHDDFSLWQRTECPTKGAPPTSHSAAWCNGKRFVNWWPAKTTEMNLSSEIIELFMIICGHLEHSPFLIIAKCERIHFFHKNQMQAKEFISFTRIKCKSFLFKDRPFYYSMECMAVWCSIGKQPHAVLEI